MDARKLPNSGASDVGAAIICSNNNSNASGGGTVANALVASHLTSTLLSSAGVLEVPSNFAENLNIYSDLLDRCKLAASHSSILKSLYLKSSTRTNNINSNNKNNGNNHNNNKSNLKQRTSLINTICCLV